MCYGRVGQIPDDMLDEGQIKSLADHSYADCPCFRMLPNTRALLSCDDECSCADWISFSAGVTRLVFLAFSALQLLRER